MTDTIFPPGSRIVVYVRDSGGPAQGESIAQQLDKTGEWARVNGLIISRVFRDEDRSGTSVAGRDAFLDMIAYLDGTVPEKGVVIWEYSRFSRSYNDAQYYLADLRRKNYIVYSMTDNVPAGLDGMALEGLKLWMNAKYSQDLGKNVRRGQRYMLELHHGWRYPVPPGYKLEAVNIGKMRTGEDRIIHRLVIDPTTAPLVKRAFEMRLAGATFRQIHQETHLCTYLQSYKDLLARRLYVGEYNYHGTFIPDYCEAIIDRDTFDRVQVFNQERATRYGIHHPRVINSRFFLSGLLFCGTCGTHLLSSTAKEWGGRYIYDYYRCGGTHKLYKDCMGIRVRKEWIEGKVMELITDRILQPDILHSVYEEVQAQTDERNRLQSIEGERIKSELADLQKRINRIVSAIRDIGHSAALVAELAQLEHEQNELQLSLERVSASVTVTDAPDFGKVVSSISTALERATDPEKGVIVRGFISKVTLTRRWRRKISGRVEYTLPIASTSQPYYIDFE